MAEMSRVSTLGAPAAQRSDLVRDAADRLFNLDVDFGDASASGVDADIQVRRGAAAGVIEVRTSWSVVERSRARSQRAASGNLLVYFIRQGGSHFENARGEQFRTHAGSVVIGSQDAPYKALAAHGKAWAFDAISVEPGLFGSSASLIRERGFQMVPAHAPLHPLLSTFVGHLCLELPNLDDASAQAGLRALDQLIAGSLGAPRGQEPRLALPAISAQRQRLAMAYVEQHFDDPAISPASIAAHLGISPRQLHRLFEACGTSVSREIRAVRVRKAKDRIRNRPGLPLTDIALGCGFDSLATFYRAFRGATGMTASEWRATGAI